MSHSLQFREGEEKSSSWDSIPGYSLSDGLPLQSFSWINPLMALGQLKPLTASDIPLIPSRYSSKENVGLFLTGYQSENRSLWQLDCVIKALVSVYVGRFAVYGMYLFFTVILAFLGPFLLSQLIKSIEGGAPLQQKLVLAFFLLFSRLLMALVTPQYYFEMGKLTISIAAALKGAIFRKVMRLSTDAKRVHSVGGISNLYSTDIDQLTRAALALHNLWVRLH